MKKIIIVFLVAVFCTPGFTEPRGTNTLLIQAEDFISYADTSPGNYDLVYRTDVDVDMNYDHDPYWYEGIRVMAIQKGEELTYTIEIPVNGEWDITFNGIINFDLYFDGELCVEGFGTPLDEKGDFRYNQDIVVPGVVLSAGTHTMTIISNSNNDFGDVQLDYIWFVLAEDSPCSPPVPPKPYDDTVPPEPPPGYVSPVSRFGRLYVDGPNIKSPVTGENASLRFVAISCPKWFPTIKNNTIYNLAYHENVHGIRLAMYAEYGTYDNPDLRPYLQEKILEIINECIDAGIYLEISYHTHATDFEIGGTAYEVEMDFYNWLLAQDVVKEKPPHLILGIINEIASGTVSWNTAKPYAQAFVDLIRTTLPENLILCGTPFWSQNPQDIAGNELAGSNIVYTFHMYTAQHEMSIADNIIACYDAGIPVWANEISPGHYDWKTWSYDFDHFNQLIYILETRDIPWTNWAWTLKGEALSALYWYSRYYGPWKNSDLTEGGKYIRKMINHSLVYSDFSDGTDGWVMDDWDKPATVEFENEEAHISYETISEYSYGQQFTLKNLRIINGITYTIDFDARSVAARTLEVAVMEDGGDYITYGSSGLLDVTTVQNHYTFSFTMNEATDKKAKIVFNAGASLDDLWLDNIIVRYSEMEEPEIERDDVVIVNENFSGECDWNFNPWQPEDSSPSARIDYTGNEAYITFQTLAEDPWGQQLSKGIYLEQGGSYVVCFDARSTVKRPLQLNIGDSVTYESHCTKDFILSTNMAPYSFRFTMTAKVTGNEVIQFNLGTDINDIWLDNVMIIKYNRMLNGDFSLGKANWDFNPWQAPASIEYTGNEAHITFDAVASYEYGQQLSNQVRLETGESYAVSFDARSTAARPLKVLITNGFFYYPAEFVLSETMKRYEYRFIMDKEATDNDMIRFDLGTDKNDIWLDNVVVRKSGNLLTNGYFSNNSKNWSTGFHEDAAGTACTVNDEYVVDITKYGSEDWHVQTIQSGLILNKGKRYLVEFDAKANADRDIIVNIGSGAYHNPEPYTSYSDGHIISIDNEKRTYSFEFTMNEPDHGNARFELNLGLCDSDVTIDNVRIIEITKISDDFNLFFDSGNWQSNGIYCFWIQLFGRKRLIRGMNLWGANGAMELRNGFDASDAKTIRLDFSCFSRGYKNTKRYNWDVQFTRDGGVTWETVFTCPGKRFLCFPFFGFNVLRKESIVLHADEYNFTDKCNFRFRSNGKNWHDNLFIDEVEISVYR
ncbi:MAG: carbohydrate binding domain-containing protein [Spirochaetales bacterium]|nr:carbohydrate binding domain-containing protein [Spirochaetales bacterium]